MNIPHNEPDIHFIIGRNGPANIPSTKPIPYTPAKSNLPAGCNAGTDMTALFYKHKVTEDFTQTLLFCLSTVDIK
jgi:hypothetical protein